MQAGAVFGRPRMACAARMAKLNASFAWLETPKVSCVTMRAAGKSRRRAAISVGFLVPPPPAMTSKGDEGRSACPEPAEGTKDESPGVAAIRPSSFVFRPSTVARIASATVRAVNSSAVAMMSSAERPRC